MVTTITTLERKGTAQASGTILSVIEYLWPFLQTLHLLIFETKLYSRHQVPVHSSPKLTQNVPQERPRFHGREAKERFVP